MISRSICPICKREVSPVSENNFFPFCSSRCREVDMARWLDGKYSISRDLTPDDYETLEREGLLPDDPGDG